MSLLRGLTAPAWLVGLARGIVEAALIAAFTAGVDAIQSGALPAELAPFAAIAILILRTLEGLADHIDPAKDRAVAVAADA